ncbi:glycerol-3-phosphate 1-O-acyltransferase PlsY [Pseudoxanthobacter sp.]|uniref:glycerol-3-phosphate 1-O-acyltransferase PlsY n=1 Tax=Pseudoxanthobacter sp. TaxID=1925742 RepID=UPI002FE05A5A
MPDAVAVSWSDLLAGAASWSSLVAVVFGYLAGSIPFGVILTRLGGAGDVRQIGSGNIGATNVLRTGRKSLAVGTLLGDMFKGTVAVLIAAAYGGPVAAILAGGAAFLGHLFPVWLGFRGGKGVATYLGLLIGLAWPLAIVFAGMWLLVALLTRYSSLSALIATAATPVIFLFVGEQALAAVFAMMTVVLWIRHAENIRRLLAGTEGRIGDRKKKAAS